MGADLIAYIVKAPRVLSKSKRLAALKQAQSVINFVRMWNELAHAEKDDELDQHLKKKPAALAEVELEELECLEETSAEDVVDELLGGWPLSYRDVSWRTDPDNQKYILLAAGEMSWGDEPDGEGYQLLKRVFLLGLDDIFGIK